MSPSSGSTSSGVLGDIHFQALCNAVENERIDKCNAILAHNHKQLHLTKVNNDGFTPIDLAFMTGRRDLLSLIQLHGGEEGRDFDPDPSEAIPTHLHSLIHESKKQVEKFGQLIKAAAAGGSGKNNAVGAQLTQAQLKECEKQQTLWQKRMSTLKRLKEGFESSGCPHAPSKCQISVEGQTVVRLKLGQPETVSSRSLYTKCKIQWSFSDSFSQIEGEKVIYQLGNDLEFVIGDLVEGKRYFLRASFGNLKGFGPFCGSSPKSVVPSTWRDLVESEGCRDGIEAMETCLQMCKDIHLYDPGEESETESHKMSKKRSGLRQLFSTSGQPKFQRHLHPNRLYLSCVFFHDDKVLMTNEEVLPVLEVLDEIPPNLNSELQWLSRLSNAWGEAERLKGEVVKINGNSYHTRLKMLQAVVAMQQILGIVDLGNPFHRPFRPPDNSVVISTIQRIKHPKSLVSLSLKWVPLTKAQRRNEENQMDDLRLSLREQILFHQVCSIRLNRGLYVCYVQAESTIDSMKIVVANTSPSILPYVKVRDNPHVTRGEWAWLSKLSQLTSEVSAMQAPSPTTNFLAGEGEEGSEITQSLQLRPTESQFAFGKQILYATERLFDYLEISSEHRLTHKVYDTEVIELSKDVSVVLVIPPGEHVCSMAEKTSCIDIKRNDLLGLPVQLFEMIHLRAYHEKLLHVYCRLNLHLDTILTLAKQKHREAFSNKEVEEAKEHLDYIQEQQQKIEETWRPLRWVLDVLYKARTKSVSVGVTYRGLSDWYNQLEEEYAPDDAQLGKNYFVKKDSLERIDHQGSSSSASGTLKTGMFGGLTRTPTTRSDPLEFNLSSSNKENEVRNFPRLGQHQFYQTKSGDNLSGGSNHHQQQQSYSSLTLSQHSTSSSLSSNDAQYENYPPESRKKTSGAKYDPRLAQSGKFVSGNTTPSAQTTSEPNILQVFAAYDTGLSAGTSVKLNVTQHTTAREVIDLVIKQLNMAVILKGKDGPIYENDELKNFCLVAVIGSKERCLRDDFKPLQLQNPWRKGKLFVRMKNDLLAAIEHISKHSTML